jgi:copper resistance protein D
MTEAALIAARFLHFAAVLVLFGLAIFPLYTYPDRVGSTPLSQWLRLRLRLAALLALLSGIAWALFTTAIMTGSLSGAGDPDTLWSVLRETGFGQIWIARLALIVALLASVRGCRSSDHPDWITPGISGVVLATLAGIGHTHVSDGAAHVVHVIADSAHLLAAGAWFGGLLPLAHVLAVARRSPADCADAGNALLRFSGMGYIAVGALALSGLINSWYLVGSVSALTGSLYGQLLVAKLCLFGAMLALAALNRFWLVPSLLRENASSQPTVLFVRLRRHVLDEQVIGLVIVSVVSLLGMMQPAISSWIPVAGVQSKADRGSLLTVSQPQRPQTD